MSDKATARPWTLGTDYIDGEDEMVCDTRGGSERVGGFLPSHANARHIVKCVNNHERLVEALWELELACSNVQEYTDCGLATPQLIDARNLLADLKRPDHD